jgi:hypothetical protein
MQRHTALSPLPQWVRPQLTELVDAAPDGPDWLHEIKYDGYRMHARLDRGAVKLLTRTGLDWTHKYPAIRWREVDSNYWSRHEEIPLGRAIWFPRTAPLARRGTDPETDEKFESGFLRQRVCRKPRAKVVD